MGPIEQNEELFATRLFQPGWWVRAFDYTSTGAAKNADVMAQALKTGLCPVLQIDELNALAAVLSQFQMQILSSDSINSMRLKIDTADFRKQAATRNRAKVFAFTRLLQALPGLRLLVDNGNRFESFPLFSGESWEPNSNGESYQFEVSLEPNGMEMVLGYSCSHQELVCQAEGQMSIATLLGPQAPLSLWRSVWVELLGLEQCLLMRMERAMQWDCRWLHFEGVFGAPLNELLAGLDLKSKSPKNAQLNTLQIASQVFSRLGRKLYHQGLLKFGVDEKYLALTEGSDEGLLMVWQASQQRSFASDNDEYKSKCIRKIQQRFRGDQLENLISYLAANIQSSSVKEKATSIWGKINEVDPGFLYSSVSNEQSSIPVLCAPLFLEWLVRAEEGHKFPVPEQFMMSPIGSIIKDSKEPFQDRYQKFVSLFLEHIEFKEALNHIPMSSLSLELNSKDPQVRKYLDRFKSNSPSELITEELVTKKDTASAKTPRAGAEKADVETKNAGSSNIRKLAADELTNMRQYDVAQYAELKRNYIASLDDSRRRLVLDVQGRMSQEHFDNHLRHSLIKYMIENPNQWRSVNRKKPSAKNINGPGAFLPILS